MADYYEEDMEEDFEPQYEVVYDGENVVYHHLVRDGVARAKFLNGDTYYGEYHNGKRHGHGVYTHINGAVYDGEYIDGLKDGQGRMSYPDGAVYQGQFKAGKREGQGKYTYSNGEEYEGGWRGDVKHGAGVYRYVSGSVFTGVWSNGNVLHGKLAHPDGSSFTGTFQATTPSGSGLFTFASGLSEFGKFEGGKWVRDGFRRPGPTAKPPSKTTAPLLHQAVRTVVKAAFKADHFEHIHMLKRKRRETNNDDDAPATVVVSPAQAPNYRQTGPESNVFVTAQPTQQGLRAVCESAQEHGFDRITWLSLRDDPVVYVNERSYHPRERRALNAHLPLPAALTAEERDDLEERFVHRVLKDVLWRGQELVYYKESFAAAPAERKNVECAEAVSDALADDEDDEPAKGVRSLRATMEALAQDEGFNVDFYRTPLSIRGRSALSAAQVDALLERLRETDDHTAVVMCSRTGRLRATLGAALALLSKTSVSAAEEEEEEEYEDDEERREPQKQEYNPANPDYFKGEYGAVMRLVDMLADGAAVKKSVDRAVDMACFETENLRESIFRHKTIHEVAAVEAQRGVWQDAVSLLKHYMELMLVCAYMRKHAANDYEVSYVQWRATEGARAAALVDADDEFEGFRWN